MPTFRGHSIVSWAGLALLLVVPAGLLGQDEEPIFSGPQPGEALVEFEVQDLISDEDTKINPVKDAAGKPTLLVFIHEVTRPSIGLSRTLFDYAGKLGDSKPAVALVFLSDDPTETQQWARRAQRALPQGVALGLSTEGAEGPGAYGLNRKVAMTVLVANENKVTANFALVQPSVQADAAKIIGALAKALGVEPPANLERQLAAQMNRGVANPRGEATVDDGRLRELLGPLLNKEASQEEVAEAAKTVDEAIAKSEPLKKRIGEICRRIIDADRLSNYGNEHAQAVLQRWAETLK